MISNGLKFMHGKKQNTRRIIQSIIVEKSTLPVITSELIKKILESAPSSD